MNDYPKYIIAGARPVKGELDADGNLGIYAFNWKTGGFDLDMSYTLRLIEGDGDDDREVSEAEFYGIVQQLKTERGLR